MKILVATQKPFSAAAVAGIKEIVTAAGHEFAALEKYAEASELIAAVADVDALIIRSDKVTAEVLDAAKQLKIVVRAGAGYDNVDLAAATAHNVVVMNTPGQNSNAVAELAIAMMIYMAEGALNRTLSAAAMSGILLANGWTGKTAACVIVFTLMHWPCSTTLLSIKKETGSRTWTALAAVLPTLCGALLCMLINLVFH